MSYSIDPSNNAITLTRGDTFIAQVGMKDRSGNAYVPESGDTIRFALKRNLLNSKKTAYVDTHPLIQKDIPINTLMLRIDPNDTKPLAFGEYVYDVEITFADGRVDTFITEAPFYITAEVD